MSALSPKLPTRLPSLNPNLRRERDLGVFDESQMASPYCSITQEHLLLSSSIPANGFCDQIDLSVCPTSWLADQSGFSHFYCKASHQHLPKELGNTPLPCQLDFRVSVIRFLRLKVHQASIFAGIEGRYLATWL
jgi:hypothetical protein